MAKQDFLSKALLIRGGLLCLRELAAESLHLLLLMLDRLGIIIIDFSVRDEVRVERLHARENSG